MRLVRPVLPGFPAAVRLLDKIERRMEWLSFPGLFKYLTFLGVIAFVCKFWRPDIGVLLNFNHDAIFKGGEIWRIFTFIFVPPRLPFPIAVEILFFYFAVMISFLVSDSLESAWGATRTTLYVLLAWGGMAAAQLVFDVNWAGSGAMLYTSLFFAFATLFPKVELALFMIIPVQVRFLAMLSAVFLALNVISYPPALLVVIPALLPYALWVLPDVIHGRKTLAAASSRRRKFVAAQTPESMPFHKCEVCHRTERDSRDLDFFVTADGKEYCSEHVPPQS